MPVKWTLVPSNRLSGLEPWWTRAVSRASRDEVFLGYIEGRTMQVSRVAEWAGAVVAAAAGCPPRTLPFVHQGKRMSVPLPPSYSRNAVTRADVGAALAVALGRDGREARVEEAATLPLKLLAASSGLGKYGRNTIVYVEGFGTAHAIMAFWTDADPRGSLMEGEAPIFKSPFPGPESLARCASCALCVSLCPTSAIPEEFGGIDVSRCIPLWNETELVLAGAWGESLRRTQGRILSFDNEKTLEAWAPLLRRNLAAFIASRGAAEGTG